MTRSTFDPAEALAGGDYALPHAADLSGELRAIPVAAERSLLPVAPAGALWSSARDMVRYLQTELAGGVAPDGTRVVSAENLAATWALAVPVPSFPGISPTVAASQTGYGLGWTSGEYHGLRVIGHAGGTNGFSAELAFLPEAQLGIVVLSNSLAVGMVLGAAFPYALQFRLLELLFDQPPRIDAELAPLTAALAAARPQPTPGVDPAAAAPYLGRYAEPELGEVSVSPRDGRLVLDTGKVRSELRPRAGGGDGAPAYLLLDPPLSILSEVAGATVTFAGGAASRLTLTIPANPTAPAQAYVFERVADATGSAATPGAGSGP